MCTNGALSLSLSLYHVLMRLGWPKCALSLQFSLTVGLGTYVGKLQSRLRTEKSFWVSEPVALTHCHAVGLAHHHHHQHHHLLARSHRWGPPGKGLKHITVTYAHRHTHTLYNCSSPLIS